MSAPVDPNLTDDALDEASFWAFVALQVIALIGEVWLFSWPPIICGIC